jgi:hypothetical protein
MIDGLGPAQFAVRVLFAIAMTAVVGAGAYAVIGLIAGGW